MPKMDQSSIYSASLCISSLCTMHEHFNSGGLPIFSVFRYHIWRHQPTCRPRECFWYSPAPQGGDCGRRRASEIPEKYPIDQNPPSRAAYLTSRLHDALRRSAVHLPLGVILPRFCSVSKTQVRDDLALPGMLRNTKPHARSVASAGGKARFRALGWRPSSRNTAAPCFWVLQQSCARGGWTRDLARQMAKRKG